MPARHISAVRGPHPGRDRLGGYREWDRRIRIREQLPDSWVAHVTRHELCHALDWQATRPDLQYPDLLERFDLEAWSDHFGVGAPEDGVTAITELYAHLCSAGPELASVLRQPCSEEEEPMSEVFAWMAGDGVEDGTHTWAVDPFPVAPSVDPPLAWSFEARVEEAGRFEVEAGQVAGQPAMKIRVRKPGTVSTSSVVLDPYTGEVYLDRTDFRAAQPEERWAPDWGVLDVDAFVGGEGMAGAHVSTPLPGLGTAHRWLLDEGRGWELDPQSCRNQRGQAVLFELEDAVFLIRLSEDRREIRWRRLGPGRAAP